MWHLLHDVGEFLIVTVILKFIIAHWIAEHIQAYAKTMFGRTERRAAIWMHYHAKAFGTGHNTDSVLDCSEGDCDVFKTSPDFRVSRAQSTSR